MSIETGKFNENAPIYLQIMHIFRQRIASGEYAPGERVLPVRDLAVNFSVNPNTMQRALSELEREGILYSERTSGRFITSDTELIEKMRNETAKKYVSEFLNHMKHLGYDKPNIIKMIEIEEENL